MNAIDRYRLADEPRPGPLSRVALPPLLVFMVAAFFQPLGYLLILFNALALNGPHRNREIGLALAAVATYYLTVVLIEGLMAAAVLPPTPARYLYAVGVAMGLAWAAFAYVSQARTFELRRYFAQFGGNQG